MPPIILPQSTNRSPRGAYSMCCNNQDTHRNHSKKITYPPPPYPVPSKIQQRFIPLTARKRHELQTPFPSSLPSLDLKRLEHLALHDVNHRRPRVRRKTCHPANQLDSSRDTLEPLPGALHVLVGATFQRVLGTILVEGSGEALRRGQHTWGTPASCSASTSSRFLRYQDPPNKHIPVYK